MCPVPDHERLNTEACQAPAFFANTQLALAVGQVGFHGPPAQTKRLRLSISCNRQIHIAGTFTTYDYMHDSESSHVAIFHGDRKTPWNAGINRIRPRPQIHFQVLEGATLAHGDETPHVNFVPSPNGWSDGTSQPFHQPSVASTSLQQSERMGRALPNGGVHAQQQHERKHGLCALRAQLWVYPTVGTTP